MTKFNMELSNVDLLISSPDTVDNDAFCVAYGLLAAILVRAHRAGLLKLFA